MGIYKVQSNGKAPRGLLVGDQVVTGGGTYVITGVRSDGSYSSVLLDQQQTTYNFRGQYDSLSKVNNSGGGNSSVNNAGVGGVGGGGSVNNAGSGSSGSGGGDTRGLEQQYLRLLEQTLNGASVGGGGSGGGGNNNNHNNSGGRTLSFAEALRLATDSLAPSYEAAYQQAADSAQQHLDRAGLHDTLYGQSLAAQAQNEVSEDLNAAVYQLALQLTQDSADYTAQQQSTALKYLLELLKLKTD